jgi:hypothetical protein
MASGIIRIIGLPCQKPQIESHRGKRGTALYQGQTGCAGRLGFGKDMGAIAALKQGKDSKSALDLCSLLVSEAQEYLNDPLRGLKIWRRVSQSRRTTVLPVRYKNCSIQWII